MNVAPRYTRADGLLTAAEVAEEFQGSPAINAKGEIIGANFDSTVLTQRNSYGYDPEINRSVLKVKDVSEQTSTASQETAAASVELARLGSDLQGWVGKFRV